MWPSVVGVGGTCWVTSIDKKTALKGYQIWEGGQLRAFMQDSCEEELAREETVYKALGSHPQILECIGLEEIHPGIHSLRLEYAPLGNVRQYIEKHEAPPLPVRVRMALDAARGLAHVHSKGFWHSDFTCRNLFLFDGLRVKVGDFGGALLQGSDWKAFNAEEAEYELPLRGRDFDERPRRAREVFALGSGIYEMVAWSRVWPGASLEERYEKLGREDFPSPDGLVVGYIVSRCWKEAESVSSVDDIVADLKAVLARIGEPGPAEEADGSLVPSKVAPSQAA